MKKRYLDIKYRAADKGSREIYCKTVVYLTPVAGLCIHASNRWNTYNDTFTKLRRSWNITQYPTGLRAFNEIYSKEIALDIVMRYMSEGFNWVGLTGEEVMASNNAEAITEMTTLVRQHIAATNKLITNE